MRGRRINFWAFLLLLVLAFAKPASCQDAGLVGTVTDPSGAVVPGAEVSVKNVNTGVIRRATTDDRGRYTISPLAIGRYTLTVEHFGFRAVTVNDIILTIGQIGSTDVVMQLGQVSETVEVVDKTPLLQTQEASLGQSVESKKVNDLPLNGRDFTQLVALTPGATTAGSGWESGNSMVLINGHRSTKTTSTVDGVMNLDQLFGGFPISPSVDAIEEFKVQGGNFSASQGMGPSNVSVRTKSGTNSIHGTVYEFLRNEKLDARDFFQPDRGILKRNQFGGSIGGPVKKDKLFYFGDYEGTREHQGYSYNITVPTRAQRQGDFSGLPDIIDPLTGNPFPDNQIPPERINEVASYFMQYLPEPNAGTQYIFSPPATLRRDRTSARIDYYMNDNNRINVAYTFNQHTTAEPQAIPAQGSLDRWGRSQSVALNWNRTVTPRTMNTLTLGWSRYHNVIGPSELGTNHTVLSGLQGLEQTSAVYPGWPSIGIGGYEGFYGFDWFPLDNPTENRQIKDDFTMIRGGHEIQLGADLRRFIWASKSAAVSRGYFGYYGDYTGDGWADFLLGLPIEAFRQYPQDRYDQVYYNLAGYVQDNWRVTPNVTLNLGLRYEYNSWPTESRNQLTSFDPVSGKFVVAHEPGQQPDLAAQTLAKLAWDLFGNLMTRAEDVGFPTRTLRFPDKNDWGPRFGLAYRPSFLPNTAIRMGFGIFYDLLNGNNNSDLTATSIPWIISQGVRNTLPVPTLDNQHLFPPFDAPGAATPNIQPIDFDPRSRIPYVEEWNFSIQHQLNPTTSLDVAYVGNKGTKLEQRVPLNRASSPGPGPIEQRRQFPDLSEGYIVQDASLSNYHAFQAKLEKRYSNGMSVLVAYTLSKSIDTASSDFGSGVQDMNNQRAERAVSSFDYPQRLSVGYTYELPFGRGRQFLSSGKGPAEHILGGWELAGIVTLQSGSPFTVNSGRDRANVGASGRADRIGSGKLDNPTLDRWFDTSAFVMPELYTFGNSGRNILRGDGLSQWDCSLLKNFAIREGMRLQFRAEFFNLPNHADFSTPNSNLSSSIFGQVTSTRTAPRIGQFALKLIF